MNSAENKDVDKSKSKDKVNKSTVVFFLSSFSCKDLRGIYTVVTTKTDRKWLEETFTNVIVYTGNAEEYQRTYKHEEKVTMDYLKKIYLQLQLRGDPKNEIRKNTTGTFTTYMK